MARIQIKYVVDGLKGLNTPAFPTIEEQQTEVERLAVNPICTYQFQPTFKDEPLLHLLHLEARQESNVHVITSVTSWM